MSTHPNLTTNHLYQVSPATNRPSGFTLIELLVVISIIALLIAILLPALKTAREAGRASKCLSNERQLFTATMVYTHDFRDTMPWGFGYYPSGSTQWSTSFVKLLPSYLSTKKDNTSVWLCPTHLNMSTKQSSYARVRTNKHWMTMRDALEPVKTLAYYDRRYFGYPHWVSNRPFWYTLSYPSPSLTSLDNRHGETNSANMIFLDGHAIRQPELDWMSDYGNMYILYWKR